MMSRGISGAVVNWQGPTSSSNQSALAVMAEAEKNSTTFQFSIEEDAAAFASCAANAGCDLQGRIISDLQFVANNYTKSPAYTAFQGRAVIFLYGMEAYNVNWTAVLNAIPQHPIIVLRSVTSSTSTIAALPSAQIGTDVAVDRSLECRRYGAEPVQNPSVEEVDYAYAA
jgi:hypothetical protein